MKILSLLIFLAFVRTCTKEPPSFTEEKVQVEPRTINEIPARGPQQSDTVIATVIAMFHDNQKTRGLLTDNHAILHSQPAINPEFFTGFTYPEEAKQQGVQGSCMVQFGINAASKIQYFSVLRTDQQVFSDAVRRTIMSSPISLTPFPQLEKGEESIRVEVQVDYKLKPTAKK